MVEAKVDVEAPLVQPNGEVTPRGGEMPLWAAMTGKVTVGSIAGYAAGNFMKQITDEIILYGGIATLLLGGLHWMRWITINWRQIDADLLHIVERAKARDQGLMARVKRFIQRTAPLLGGFSAGFYYGFMLGG